jgi:hypothetical protein
MAVLHELSLIGFNPHEDTFFLGVNKGVNLLFDPTQDNPLCKICTITTYYKESIPGGSNYRQNNQDYTWKHSFGQLAVVLNKLH